MLGDARAVVTADPSVDKVSSGVSVHDADEAIVEDIPSSSEGEKRKEDERFWFSPTLNLGMTELVSAILPWCNTLAFDVETRH